MQLLEAPESAHQTLRHSNGDEALPWLEGAHVNVHCGDVARSLTSAQP